MANRDGDSASYVLKEPKRRSKRPRDQGDDQQLRRFRLEVRYLQALNSERCPNIVSIVDSNVEAGEGNWPWYVMPYYASGAMFDAKRKPSRYIENYGENVPRVLEIAEPLAEALAFMHSAGIAHRDVKAGNVFFNTVGGDPVLGDFGIAHGGEQHEPDLTSQSESLGPKRWRPPELRIGGGMNAHPKSDVYMLGGLIYELLSGGRTIEETQRADGSFAHDDPAWSLSTKAPDPRLEYVNQLLRNMLRRNPEERISSTAALGAIRNIRSWNPGETSPIPRDALGDAERALAKYMATSPTERAQRLRRELKVVCDRVASEFGMTGWAPMGQVTKMVTGNVDSIPEEAVREHAPDLAWWAVRVLVGVDLGHDRRYRMSYVVLGRQGDEEIVASVDENKKWRVLARDAPGSPQNERLIQATARQVLERLLADFASRIDAEQ